MSQAIHLAATLRQGKVSDIKEIIPAVVYGNEVEATSLAVKRNEFEKVFAVSGESGLISLKLEDGREMPVIVKDYQADAVRDRVIHVDFYKVNMKEKVTAEVSLEYVGEAPAVKTFGGIVVHNFDTLEIECLPSDLIQKIDIDLSKLANIGDAIHISDIKAPNGVEFTSEPETMIAQVIEQKKTVEDAAADAAIEATAAANAAATEAGGAKPAEEKKEEKK